MIAYMAKPRNEARGDLLRQRRIEHEARLGRRITQRDVARFLGINEYTYRSYENGYAQLPERHARTLASEWGVPLESFYRVFDEPKVDKRLGSLPMSVKESDDSGPDPRAVEAAGMVSDQRTIRVAILVGDGALVWSAKGAQRDQLMTFAYLGESREVVKLAESSLATLGNRFRPGTILVFERDEYPRTDVFLLAESREDPDLRSIRWIEPDHADQLVGEGVDPVPLSGWRVRGFAYAEIRGSSGAQEIDIRPAGIGPRRR